ncbi:methionyl-tRNA formyltransferase [Candidatus Tremblaya phenacola PAVE]|nr:methionyl-tRNA formyltransferase [Candidatus Tremblaya phenacola PAVE]
MLCQATKNLRASTILTNPRRGGPLTILKQSPIRTLGPHLQMLLDCGSKIPEGRIQLSSVFLLNMHSSSLPNWKGPSPIGRALWSNSFLGGVTAHEVWADFDTGPPLLLLTIPSLLKDDYWAVQHHISVRLVESFSFFIRKRGWTNFFYGVQSECFGIRLRLRIRAYARRVKITSQPTNLRSHSPSTIQTGKLFCLALS